MASEINKNLFLYMNGLAGSGGVLDTLASFFANGAGIVLALVVVIFIAYRERGLSLLKTNLIVFVPVIIAALYSEVLKLLFLSSRPAFILDNVNLLYEYGGADSFPSSHATIYAALAASVFFYNRKLGTLLFLAALLIGFSRIIVGVHWPIDVLVGFIIGTLVSYSSHYYISKLISKSKQ